jgi:succinate dehydrogenase/fumarate reductase cytochrome b subunit
MSMALLSTLASAGLFGAHANYREELTAMAQAAKTATQFWCGMNDYGRELSLLHMVTGIAGFGLGSMLLAAPTGAMLAERVFVGAANGKGWNLIERLSSWGFIVFGAVLLLGAAYMHTVSGWETWTSTFGNPPTFFCKNVPAYGR